MAATWIERLLEPEHLQIDAHALALSLSLLGMLLGTFVIVKLIRRFGEPDSGLSRSEAVLGFPVGIMAFILPSVVALFFAQPLVAGDPWATALVQIPIAVVGIFVLANHPWREGDEPRGTWYRAQPKKLMWVPLVWLLGLPVLQLAMLASVQLHQLIGASIDTQGVVDQLRGAEGPGGILAWYVMAVVAAPLMEEFVFRVVLFGGTRRLLQPISNVKGWRHPGMWFAMAFSITAFVLAHGVWGWTVGILPLTLLSVFLTLIYAHTRSIWASVLYHALHNAFVVTMQLFVLR